MKVFVATLAVVAILAIGCKKGGYDAGLMAALPEPERKIVGKYKLEYNTSQSNEVEEMKKAMEMLDSFRGPITLECLPDKTFTLIALDTPVTGKWSMTGTLIQLRPEKVGEMRVEDIGRTGAKNQGVSGWDMGPGQRTEYLEAAKHAVVLEQAQDLTLLQVGIDGKSLYATKQNSASLFGSGVSVFRQVKE